MTRCPNLCAFTLQQSTEELQTTIMSTGGAAACHFRKLLPSKSRSISSKVYFLQTPSCLRAISTFSDGTKVRRMNSLNIIQLAVLAPAFSLFCQDVFWTQHMAIKVCPKGKCVRSSYTNYHCAQTNTLGLEYRLPSVSFRYANHLRLSQHSAEHMYAYLLTVGSPALLPRSTSNPQDHVPDNGFTQFSLPSFRLIGR